MYLNTFLYNYNIHVQHMYNLYIIHTLLFIFWQAFWQAVHQHDPQCSDGRRQYVNRTPQSTYQRIFPYQHNMQHSQRSNTREPGQVRLHTLIQQQQSMLQQVLHNQASFETRQADLEERLANLESSVSASMSSNSSEGKKKRIVTRPLTVSSCEFCNQ